MRKCIRAYICTLGRTHCIDSVIKLALPASAHVKEVSKTILIQHFHSLAPSGGEQLIVYVLPGDICPIVIHPLPGQRTCSRSVFTLIVLAILRFSHVSTFITTYTHIKLDDETIVQCFGLDKIRAYILFICIFYHYYTFYP